MAVDTCAALSTGNIYYLLALAKQYPHCIDKIYGPKEYAKITLTGVVTDESHPVSTNLDTTFQFLLPYKTTDGEQCSFCVAAGKNVAVNIILGLPFLQKMKCVVDFPNNVLDCQVLDAPPFPMEYRRTSNHVPMGAAMPQVNTSNISARCKDTIRELDNLEQFFRDTPLTPPAPAAQVHFGSKLDQSLNYSIKYQCAVTLDDEVGQM
jgi:hypothetical protein